MKIPLKGGLEYDALTKASKYHNWRPGQKKQAKKTYNKRLRRQMISKEDIEAVIPEYYDYLKVQEEKVNHRPFLDTERVEKLYSEKDGVPVKYVCTSALDGGTVAMDIFYRETPHPVFGNKYFGLRWDDRSRLLITNADKIEELSFTMILGLDGWEYSRQRWDFFWVGTAAIDGGRAYSRIVGVPKKTTVMRVKNGEFVDG